MAGNMRSGGRAPMYVAALVLDAAAAAADGEFRILAVS